jgi:ribonuclease-3 family protein
MLFEAVPTIDLREQSPLALAFVGDAVLELLVRQRLVETTRMQPGRLHATAVAYVSARAQNRELELLEPLLTEEESEELRRGRNASKATVAKHASAQEYRASTGFECLLGWLYLQNRQERIQQLFEILWQGYQPD